MIYLDVPDNRQVSFYLAMEEHLARHFRDEEFLFMWQVDPSVIYGRNQVLEQEVNLSYCREHGISVFRRKSGGGCVYADRGNVMLSMVMNGDNVGLTYNRFVTSLMLCLRRMGVNVSATGRNDLLVAAQGEDASQVGRKVSGMAYYLLPGRSIVHSTLLYDTNMQNMLGSITPPPQKLQSKGISSVRQRITLLKDFTTLSLAEVRQVIRDTLCQGEYHLTEDDIREAERLAR